MEAAAEGIRWSKEERYEITDEEGSILKAPWTARGPVDFDGRYYTSRGARISPPPLQESHPRFHLGGGSPQAWEMAAKHADVHLFWGDTYGRIAGNMDEIHALAARHGRQDEIGFGMRLQIICRETESGAWDAAHALVREVTEGQTRFIRTHYAGSAANRRVQELARAWGPDRAASLDRHHKDTARGRRCRRRQPAAMWRHPAGLH